MIFQEIENVAKEEMKSHDEQCRHTCFYYIPVQEPKETGDQNADSNVLQCQP